MLVTTHDPDGRDPVHDLELAPLGPVEGGPDRLLARRGRARKRRRGALEAVEQRARPERAPEQRADASNPAHANYISQYEGGTVKWWGVLTGHQWIMHGVGYVTDPTGKTQVVRREATSTIKIQPSLKQELNSNAWNFMFAKDIANDCDVTLEQRQRRHLASSSSAILLQQLVRGRERSRPRHHEHLRRRAHPVRRHRQVGTAANKINQAQVGLGCRIGTSGAWTTPCSSSTRATRSRSSTARSPVRGRPPTSPSGTNAKPGLMQACTTTTGTPPKIRGLARRRDEQQRRHGQPDAGTRATAASTTTSRRTTPTCSASSPGTTRPRS